MGRLSTDGACIITFFLGWAVYRALSARVGHRRARSCLWSSCISGEELGVLVDLCPSRDRSHPRSSGVHLAGIVSSGSARGGMGARAR